jgi:hypothetical protein
MVGRNRNDSFLKLWAWSDPGLCVSRHFRRASRSGGSEMSPRRAVQALGCRTIREEACESFAWDRQLFADSPLDVSSWLRSPYVSTLARRTLHVIIVYDCSEASSCRAATGLKFEGK